MKAPAWGPAQQAAYEEARRVQRIHNAAAELMNLLTLYVHQDETANDTDNNLYRRAKALIEKLGGAA